MEPPDSRYPALDHFMTAYMNQDWDLHGPDLPSVVQRFAADSGAEQARHLRADIIRFLQDTGQGADAEYRARFPDGVLPSAWSMTAAQWLRMVHDLAGAGAAPAA